MINNNDSEANWHGLAPCMLCSIESVDDVCMCICALTIVVQRYFSTSFHLRNRVQFYRCRSIAACIASLLSVQFNKWNMERMCVQKWQTVTIAQNKSINYYHKKINYNSVQPHSHIPILVYIDLASCDCDCLVYICTSWMCGPKRRCCWLFVPVPLLQQQQQFIQSNLHLNERSNRLFPDLQALTNTRTHTFKYRKTSCCPDFTDEHKQYQQCCLFQKHAPNTHITLDEFKNVKWTGSRPTYFFFFFFFLIHYHVFKWESKHQRVWQLTLS